jgi:hypothetical protein
MVKRDSLVNCIWFLTLFVIFVFAIAVSSIVVGSLALSDVNHWFWKFSGGTIYTSHPVKINSNSYFNGNTFFNGTINGSELGSFASLLSTSSSFVNTLYGMNQNTSITITYQLFNNQVNLHIPLMTGNCTTGSLIISSLPTILQPSYSLVNIISVSNNGSLLIGKITYNSGSFTILPYSNGILSTFILTKTCGFEDISLSYLLV